MVLLRILFFLLPVDFRRQHGEELLATLREQWAELGPSPSLATRSSFLRRQGLALLRANWGLRTGIGILGAADRPSSVVTRAEFTRGVLSRGVERDLRHAIRALRARPTTTAVAVITLALGIGVTTSMYATVNAVLLRSLPYDAAERVVVLRQVDLRDGSSAKGISAANLRDLASAATTLSRASLAHANGFTLLEEGRAVSLRGWLVSEGFFEAIGGATVLGRTFRPEEYQPGNEKVVLLGHHTWQTRFAGDRSIVGRRLILDGASHRVVGVMEPDFRYPSVSELWAPRPPLPWDEESRAVGRMEGIARLAPGIGLDRAQEELDRLAADLTAAHPRANAHLGFEAIPLRRYLLGDVESPLMLLLGAVGLVLLIAIANVAGLQLVRGAGRAREFALRSALGASAGRLLRLVTLESLLLAGLGSALGIGLAYSGLALIRILGPGHLPRIDGLRLDGSVLVFAVVAAVISAVLAALAPALVAASADPNGALREGSRGSTHGPRTSRASDRLVVAEIALALVLMIGAGLLVRSFDRLFDNELGFDPDGVLAVQVFAYDGDHRPKTDFFPRSVEAIVALPGVEAVGLTTYLPLSDDRSFWASRGRTRFTIDDRPPPPPGSEPEAGVLAIDGEYARALAIALRAGRGFSLHDDAFSNPVVMVNEAFARRHLGGRDPIGLRLTPNRGGGVSREIVGVLADVRPGGLESEPRPEIYLPLAQAPAGALTFVVRASGDIASLAKTVRQTIWEVDPGQAIWASGPMNDLLWDWTRRRRFDTVLLSLFAALALALAAIGVYGLVSYSVAQRLGEMGIRRALGGQSKDILGLVLARGLGLTLRGLVLGLLGSLALARLLDGMLYGVGPFDLATFVGLSIVVAGVALLATLVPARRATRVGPMAALRSE